MENIPAVYYINLPSRTDRKEQMETELRRVGFQDHQIHRINAIATPGFGALGCGKSHIQALQTFLASSHEVGLILEDDFMVNIDVNWARFLVKTLFADRIDFDVVMLAGNIMKDQLGPQPYLRKVLDAQTASAYLVTKQFAPKILNNFQEAVQNLESWHNTHGERKHEFCIDQSWKSLQPPNRWYIFYPKVGLQRESYSDNELRVTNYGV